MADDLDIAGGPKSKMVGRRATPMPPSEQQLRRRLSAKKSREKFKARVDAGDPEAIRKYQAKKERTKGRIWRKKANNTETQVETRNSQVTPEQEMADYGGAPVASSIDSISNATASAPPGRGPNVLLNEDEPAANRDFNRKQVTGGKVTVIKIEDSDEEPKEENDTEPQIRKQSDFSVAIRKSRSPKKAPQAVDLEPQEEEDALSLEYKLKHTAATLKVARAEMEQIELEQKLHRLRSVKSK